MDPAHLAVQETLGGPEAQGVLAVLAVHAAMAGPERLAAAGSMELAVAGSMELALAAMVDSALDSDCWRPCTPSIPLQLRTDQFAKKDLHF